MLQNGGSVDDGVMLLARCGTALLRCRVDPPCLLCRLLGNEGDAGGESQGISSQKHSGDGRGMPGVPCRGMRSR
jgi:hypothetical protein